MGADAKLMKELNKRQLRRILRQCKEATKPELADRTGLSVVTINSLLEDLLKTGEVVQSGLALPGEDAPARGTSTGRITGMRCCCTAIRVKGEI